MNKPLAERMRPKKLEDIVGQDHLIGDNKLLSRAIEQKKIFSMILYGGPGIGKTSIAKVMADNLGYKYSLFNAVTNNKSDLTKIFEESKHFDNYLLIIDEIHRLNKDKQDLLLPYIENGDILVIGCTTSNPLISINPAIRSRCQILEIKQASIDDITNLLIKTIKDPNGLNNKVTYEYEAVKLIAKMSGGDIRYALNLLELVTIGFDHIDNQAVETYGQFQNVYMDKDGDNHYNTISAFQKSIRGSDVDAALYYLSLLVKANDMDSIERRLLTCCYEDIGLGNPNACMRTYVAIQAAKTIGFPEARIPLANAVIDLCLSPKSKSSELAIDRAMKINETYDIPSYLKLNNPFDQTYDYNNFERFDKIQYLPDELKNIEFYKPNTNSKYEKALAANLYKIKKINRTKNLNSLNKKSR